MVHAVKHRHSASVEKSNSTNDRASFQRRPIRTSDSLEVFEVATHIHTLKQVTDNMRGAKALATALTIIVALAVGMVMFRLFGVVGLILFIGTTSYYTTMNKETNRWWMNQHRSK